MRTHALALLVGCGSVNTVMPDAAPPTVGAVLVTGTDQLTWPASTQLTATAEYSDGTKVDVTTQVVWSSEQPIVASVDASGLVTSLDHGMSAIHAKYLAFDNALPVTVTVPTMVVSNYSGASILFFPANATGNVAPTRTISGALTTLSSPRGIAVVGQELVVIDQGAKAIDVFPLNGNGNIAPTRRIVGATNTTLSAPSQLAVANGEIYLGDQTTAMKVFPLNGNGDIAPTRQITGLTATLGVATTATEVYVSSYSGNTISVFPIAASGAATPTRKLVGPATGLSTPQAMLVVNNELVVACSTGPNNGSLNTYAATAANDTAPLRSINGVMPMLNYPDQFAFAGNRVFIASYNNSMVQVFTFTDTGNIAPLQSIAGAMTGLNSDLGIAIY